jgi:hypothetical protein
MPVPTEFFRWWIPDELTGKHRLTAYKLTRADAGRAFPGAEPEQRSREVRDLADPSEAPGNSRPGGKWA